MDHLPRIENPVYPPPRIPCLCQPQDYDGQGVVGFPERVGWKIDRDHGPVRMDENKRLIESPAALLRSWLYFGMLYDVLQIGGLDFDLRDFEQSIDGESFVTAAPLREYLDGLARGPEGARQEICHQRQELVRDCLKVVLGISELHWDAPFQFGRWTISSVLSLDVIMSIAILGETLKNGLIQMWPMTSGLAPLSEVFTALQQNPLQNRLRKHDCCPNEIMMLFKELDLTGLYLASLLRRPFAQALQHDKCSDEECLALQTSDSDYTTKHVDECLEDSSCTNIAIDQSKISSILRSGCIPIIHVPIFPEDRSPPQVKVLDYHSNGIEFIAFSHVWAHGIGNPKQNALPSCQILRLKYVSAKSATVWFRQPAFWIDTLCIPVAPEYKTARKLAIARLAGTFRQARQVLVLDADLQRSSKFCSRTELAIRTMCSGWMRRLWTLQEAVMSEKAANASKVDVQFGEGALEFNSVAGKSVRNLYHTESAMASIFSAFPQFRTRDRTYASLARALRYRTTSKKEDEAVYLALILGLDHYQIAAIVDEATAETRMQRMYTFIE